MLRYRILERVKCVLRISGLYTSRLLDAASKKVLNLLKKGLLFEAKTFKVNEELRKVCWWEIVRRRPTAATKNHMILSYDVLIIQNIRVILLTVKMEVLLEPTSNKLMVVSIARLGVNVYTVSYHEFVLLRIVLSTAHWNFSTASSLFILLVSTASIIRYRTTKIDGMADIEWHTEMDFGQNWKTNFI
ncbi:hypothetical protein Tco_0990175 [Tanacetum coccineum]|uniref:Uncharacterized protein n=1 Tax=Tanacetum coccineum TaxID=301880 RepID=A0ABQ5EVP6_9ASTR